MGFPSRPRKGKKEKIDDSLHGSFGGGRIGGGGSGGDYPYGGQVVHHHYGDDIEDDRRTFNKNRPSTSTRPR